MNAPESAMEEELRARIDQVELLHRQVEALKRDLEVKNALLTSYTRTDVGSVPSEEWDPTFPAYVGVANRTGYKIVDKAVFFARRLPGYLWVRTRRDRLRPATIDPSLGT